jgi:hypothetical protein
MPKKLRSQHSSYRCSADSCLLLHATLAMPRRQANILPLAIASFHYYAIKVHIGQLLNMLVLRLPILAATVPV